MASLELELAETGHGLGLEGLLVTPRPEDYWVVRAVDIAELLLVSDVAITITTTQPTSYDARLSGTSRSASTIVRSAIAVSALIRQPVGFNAPMRRGRKLQLAELLEEAADVYRGAMQQVLLRDAVDGVVILDAFPESDFAESIVVDQLGTVGRAIVEFEITGEGRHPVPTYQLARENA